MRRRESKNVTSFVSSSESSGLPRRMRPSTTMRTSFWCSILLYLMVCFPVGHSFSMKPPVSLHRPTTTTQLQLSPTAALVSSLSGGLFAGGLHAIAGPDHLAALLPRCMGQRWYRSVRVGAIWGVGHGISATLLGCLAFGIKRASSSFFYTGKRWQWWAARGPHLMEIAVGVSLIVIGIMGLKEAREWQFEPAESAAASPHKNLSSAVNVAVVSPPPHEEASTTKTVPIRTRAILLNGLLHGFSWDGAPSLAPALALITWGHTISFLSAYALGTTLTMALVTTVVGEGTRRASQIFHRPDLPQKFSLASSLVAIAIGLIWCGLGLR